MGNFVSNLDSTVLHLNDRDSLSLRQMYEGVHIWGAPGSGKTSGSGSTLAEGLIRLRCGIFVACSKPSEIERWQEYARANGRENSLFIFDENQGFNFIEYALARYGMSAITNVVGILIRVLDDARKAMGNKGSDSTPYWDESITKMLKYSIPVLYSAYGAVTIETLIDFAVKVPHTDDKWAQAAKNISSNPAAAALAKMSANPVFPLDKEEKEKLIEFWVKGEWKEICADARTRANILSSYTARLDLFRHGILRKCFCGKTTWIPEMLFHGCITVAAMPVQANETEGRLAQMVLKYMTQLALEGRNALPDRRHHERPVVLWIDEAHRFVSVKDQQFLSECRESRTVCVFLSQGLPSYYSALGADESKTVDAMVGKFGTQIFHQNACTYTNKFASEMIGRGLQTRRTMGVNESQNLGFSVGSNEGGSRGTNSSVSRGRNASLTLGRNESLSQGQSESFGETRSFSRGGSHTTSSGRSGGHSSSTSADGKSSRGSNSGWNNSESDSSSWNSSTGSSHTTGFNTSHSIGTSESRSVGTNESESTGTNESQSWGSNKGKTWGRSVGSSYSEAEAMDNLIEPNYFATSLLSGGTHRIVTALLFRSGAFFANGKNHMLVGFEQ